MAGKKLIYLKIKNPNNYIRTFIAAFIFLIAVCNGLALGASNKEVLPVKQDIINIDFNLLGQVEKYVNEDESDLKEIPQNIQALNGKLVKITGYLLLPPEAYYINDPVNNFVVCKNAYGCPCCSWGNPPSIFNAVIVDMNEGKNISPPFPALVEVTGIFHFTKEQFIDEDGQKRLDTLFYINKAQVGKKI
ncbi:MAG: hypothetical protein V1747_08440 [Candidatus Omnitrophota bacterium]